MRRKFSLFLVKIIRHKQKHKQKGFYLDYDEGKFNNIILKRKENSIYLTEGMLFNANEYVHGDTFPICFLQHCFLSISDLYAMNIVGYN